MALTGPYKKGCPPNYSLLKLKKRLVAYMGHAFLGHNLFFHYIAELVKFVR